jgi:DNA modification methylase
MKADNAAPLGSVVDRDKLAALLAKTRGLLDDRPGLRAMMDRLREREGLAANGNGAPPVEPSNVDETEAERLAKEHGVESGQVWRLGRHIIACLDCLERTNIERLVDGQKVGMVWADPPYGVKFDPEKDRGGPFGGIDKGGSVIPSIPRPPVIGDNTTETAKQSFALLSKLYPASVNLWWGANYYTDILTPSPGWIVWDKDNGSNDFADCEMAWTNQGRAARIFKHRWNGMLKASEQGQRRVHPTQKPIALALECLREYGKPGDLIIDPFLGSGISVLAAEQLNDDRRVIGFELAPAYTGVTIHRWEKLTGQKAELLQDAN